MPLSSSSVVLRRISLREELEPLHRFIQEGGKVLFMIDPFYSFPNLSAFLSIYDVVLGNDVIVDPYNRTFGGDEYTIMIPLFLKHPIIQDFRTPVLFPLARSVEVKGNSKSRSFRSDFCSRVILRVLLCRIKRI